MKKDNESFWTSFPSTLVKNALPGLVCIPFLKDWANRGYPSPDTLDTVVIIMTIASLICTTLVVLNAMVRRHRA